MYNLPSGNRSVRKRRQDQEKRYPNASNNLVGDRQIMNPLVKNVAESSKVKQYLSRLNTQNDKGGLGCIKIVLCDLEVLFLSQGEQDILKEDFEIDSIYLSGGSALTLDRIVTLHGSMECILRCALFIAFLITSNANNYSKTEAFTLKSLNYHLSALIEVNEKLVVNLLTKYPQQLVDTSQYERNSGLYVANLSGDLSSMFKSLIFIVNNCAYNTYANDEHIDMAPIINVHDGESLHSKLEGGRHTRDRRNAEIFNYVRSTNYSN